MISSALATAPAHIFNGNSFNVHHNSISSHPFTPSFSCNRLGFIFVAAEAPTGHCSSCVVYRAVIALCHCLAAHFAARLHGATVVLSSSLAHRPFIHLNPVFSLFSLLAPRLIRARVCYTHTKAVLQSSANSKPHPLYLCYLFAFICINKLLQMRFVLFCTKGFVGNFVRQVGAFIRW